MHAFFLTIIFTLFINSTHIFGMELAPQQPTQLHIRSLNILSFYFYITTKEECAFLSASKSTWSSLFPSMRHCKTQQQINCLFLTAVDKKDLIAARYIFDKYAQHNKTAFSCITDRHVLCLPRRIFLSPLEVADYNEDEPMRDLLENIGLGKLANTEYVQRLIASGISVQPNRLLLACIGDDLGQVADALKITSKTTDEKMIEDVLHAAITRHVTNKDQSIIELLFADQFLRDRMDFDSQLQYYLQFARDKSVKNQPNYIIQTLEKLRDGYKTFQAIRRKNATNNATEKENWDKKIQALGISNELQQFISASIAKNYQEAIVHIDTPEMKQSIENNPTTFKMLLQHIVEDNVKNPDASTILENFFFNYHIRKFVSHYDASDYISFAEDKFIENNYALQALKKIQCEYPRMQADDMYFALPTPYALRKNQRPEPPKSFGQWAWDLSSGIVAQGTAAVQQGATAVRDKVANTAESVSNATQYGVATVRSGANAATNTAYGTGMSLYASLPSIPSLTRK